MINKPTLTRLIFVLIVLALASLACNLPGASQPTLPPTAAPLDTTQIQNLEQQIQATLANTAPNTDVSITLTQDQLNALITAKMAEQSDQLITEPSVKLTGGHMEVYGKITQSGISANLKVVLQPAVDNDGTATLNVTSISLGGIPVPDVLKDRIETAADSAISNAFASSGNGFKAKSISIDEGQMTVTGTRQ